MPGPIFAFLADDHARLDALLTRATAAPDRIDAEAYRELRAGLLRHIAMEEKVLFADARARRGGEHLPVTRQLHADHAAIASILVPPPTHALIATLRQILVEHNPLEEGPGGLYEACEALAGAEVPALLARMHAIPPVRVSEPLDEPRIHEHIARMVAARTPAA
ncbi:MAG: hemerythrin domain-containing protein [Kofleriaceae bacterium]|nr:hemerythrin domain-containing protein [Kofleriaceae bacterium]MCL4225298.1 hemerythrin domain-containing protein [Myxococcales bacterium]